MLAVMDADFIAVDDANVLVIPRLDFSKLGIALFTVSFSVFIIVHHNLRNIKATEVCVSRLVFIVKAYLCCRLRQQYITDNFSHFSFV
jgi:hypothetical protein